MLKNPLNMKNKIYANPQVCNYKYKKHAKFNFLSLKLFCWKMKQLFGLQQYTQFYKTYIPRTFFRMCLSTIKYI